MRTISIRNPDLAGQEHTFITTPYTSGVTLLVANTYAFAADQLSVVGEPGEEKTELKKIASLTAPTTITLASALNFPHQQSTPVYRTPWDFVELSYYLGGVWTVLSQTGIQWDKPYTVYVHTAGDATFSYRWRFYNSVTATYSEYGPTYGGSGFEPNMAGAMIRNARKLTHTENTNEQVVSDRELYDKINTAQDIIYGGKNRLVLLAVQ